MTLKAVKTGQSHILHFMLAKFLEVTEEAKAAGRGAEAAVLGRLAALFALADVVDGQQWAGLLPLEQVS
jgi:hypothetical protein